jgi:hypothetical protein
MPSRTTKIERLGHAPKVTETDDKLKSDRSEFGGGRLKKEGAGSNDRQMYGTDVSDEEGLCSFRTLILIEHLFLVSYLGESKYLFLLPPSYILTMIQI